MAYSDREPRRLGRVLLLVFGVAVLTATVLAGRAEPAPRGATGPEVVQAAAKCGATVTRFGPTLSDNSDDGLPNVSLTIDVRNPEEWGARANCVYFELKALGAMSFIGGPNGEDLLISSGRDRIY